MFSVRREGTYAYYSASDDDISRIVSLSSTTPTKS